MACPRSLVQNRVHQHWDWTRSWGRGQHGIDVGGPLTPRHGVDVRDPLPPRHGVAESGTASVSEAEDWGSCPDTDVLLALHRNPAATVDMANAKGLPVSTSLAAPVVQIVADLSRGIARAEEDFSLCHILYQFDECLVGS